MGGYYRAGKGLVVLYSQSEGRIGNQKDVEAIRKNLQENR